ncbi:MAG: cobyric acid synthase [Candidatus Omnitrophica bacterium]|nr:cobyric acid synthase [Candidatus Omnitrophota bacterium]
MFQGTGSHVGKSVLATALCRILRRRGIRAAPFKAMNMSNNAWVTRAGGEMAYAQAAQAWAAGVEPAVEMNPVLLKPEADHTSSLIVLGKPEGRLPAMGIREVRERLIQVMEESLNRLAGEFEFIVIEGAGSPAEVNLAQWDLANMAVARKVRAPVILVGDIERGGVFAQIVGTLALLNPEDLGLVRGFVINKFRGERSLLDPGLTWLEQRTGLPVFGVVPFLHDLRIPQEDAVALSDPAAPLPKPSANGSWIRIQVVRYPQIANFTDFKPLEEEPGVQVEYLTRPPPDARRPRPHLLILPGTKSTVSDLQWLRERGFEPYLKSSLQAGVEVLGICGGFQMLGEWIRDPAHVESAYASVAGLGLLPASTRFTPAKVTVQVEGVHPESGLTIRGYELHAGCLEANHKGEPVFRITRRGGQAADGWDGCRLADLPVWGTYLHGLFDEPGFRRWFLNRLLPRGGEGAGEGGDPYDFLADQVEKALNLSEILPLWKPSV